MKKSNISYKTIRKNQTLEGFTKPSGAPLEEEEEVENKLSTQ